MFCASTFAFQYVTVCFVRFQICSLPAFDGFSDPSSWIHETVKFVTDVGDKKFLDKNALMFLGA